MTALTWRKLKTFSGAPPCDGGCKTDAKARGIGIYRMEILGWPCGFWCRRCQKQMQKAWDLPNPELQAEPAVPEAVAA